MLSYFVQRARQDASVKAGILNQGMNIRNFLLLFGEKLNTYWLYTLFNGYFDSRQKAKSSEWIMYLIHTNADDIMKLPREFTTII